MIGPNIARRIATPPMRGIGRGWILRAPGRSTMPNFSAIRATIGVRKSAAKAEAMNVHANIFMGRCLSNGRVRQKTFGKVRRP